MSTVQHFRVDHLGTRNRGWRADAWRRADRLGEDLEDLTTSRAAVAKDLEEARSHIDDGQVDEVWQRLHRVEEEIGRHARGGLLVDYAVWAVDHAHDPALTGRATFQEVAGAWQHVTSAARAGRVAASEEERLAAEVACVLRHAHSITDERHFDANDARKRLLLASLAMTVLSALVVVAASVMAAFPFLLGEGKFAGVPTWQLALVVALGGLVGGSVGALPAFTTPKRDRYRLQHANAAIRLALGVLAALVGVSLVGAGWVTGLAGDSAPALFAVAVAFGLTQEPVTRLLEKQAGKAATESSGSSDKANG